MLETAAVLCLYDLEKSLFWFYSYFVQNQLFILFEFLYLSVLLGSLCCSRSRISPRKVNTGLSYLICILHEGRKHINLHMLCEPSGTLWTGSRASHNAPCVEHWWQKGDNWSVLSVLRGYSLSEEHKQVQHDSLMWVQMVCCWHYCTMAE